MTRKDYEAIAQAIRQVRNDFDYDVMARCVITALTGDIGKVLAKDNPRFDFHRFVVACGGNIGVTV